MGLWYVRVHALHCVGGCVSGTYVSRPFQNRLLRACSHPYVPFGHDVHFSSQEDPSTGMSNVVRNVIFIWPHTVTTIQICIDTHDCHGTHTNTIRYTRHTHNIHANYGEYIGTCTHLDLLVRLLLKQHKHIHADHRKNDLVPTNPPLAPHRPSQS